MQNDAQNVLFRQGNAGFNAMQQRQEDMEKQRNEPSRFWLPVGESAEVTFLDTLGFYVVEHQYKVQGRWGGHAVCLADLGECPLCEVAGPNSHVGRGSMMVVYSIINHRSFQTRKGETIQNYKQLMCMKTTVAQKFQRKRENPALNGDITLARFRFTRDAAGECNTGEDIEFVRKMTRDELMVMKHEKTPAAEWLQPYDYFKVFTVPTVEQLRRVAGQNVVGSYDSNPPQGAAPSAGGAMSQMDDIPFDVDERTLEDQL